MRPRAFSFTAVVAIASLAAACAKPPPPKPPEEPVEPEPKVEVKKPPPKKCEALTENCEAKASTRAKIAKTDLVFTPAAGWHYAQASDGTIAQASDEGPAVAFVAFEGDAKDAKKDSAARETAYGDLLKQVGITPGKKKINWRRPDKTDPVGSLKVDFWQLEGGARGAKKGPVLVVHSNLDGGKDILGVAFVPDDDTSGADELILKSIESIGPKDGKK